MQNTSRPINNTSWGSFLNALGLMALPIWLLLCWSGPWLHLSPAATTSMGVAGMTAITVQLLRGLIGFIPSPSIPSWLPIGKLDNNRQSAECLLMMLILWPVAYVCCPGELNFKQLIPAIGIFDVSLAILLIALSVRQGIRKGDVTIMIASLKFAAVFFSPMIAVASVCAGIFYLIHGNQLDFSFLCVSAVIPLMVAVTRLMLKDERDRIKNTNKVIVTQFLALPLVPITFFLLKQFWPAQQVNPMSMIFGLFVLQITIGLLAKRRKKVPWLIKEKLQILRAQLYLQKQGKLDSLPPEFEKELTEVRQELAALQLASKNPLDYIDKAETYGELARLERDLNYSQDAEKNFVNAIETYDDVLQLDPENGVALSNRAKVVEELRVFRDRLRDDE